MNYFYITDKGKVRDHNEDCVSVIENQSGEILMAIADGMGGHKAGEVASSLAIKHLEEKFLSKNAIGSRENAIKFLDEITEKISKSIFSYADECPLSRGLGTTLVVSIITNEYILVGNIGDSSCYVLKKGKLYKVTIDHTYVNLLLKNGDITKEEAEIHPRRNILMRALGANNPIEIDKFDVDIDKDLNGLIMCSDGLSNLVSKEQIAKVLDNEESIEQQVFRLLRKANNRGGHDNISIAYITFDEDNFNV
ncbi:MAG: Stp1/IreP family PP2C-type Ser/Thr phosphatase [Bacilli bacterium]